MINLAKLGGGTMRKLTIPFLLLLAAGSLPTESQGTETNSEILLDSQGHRFDDERYDAIRELHNQEQRGIAKYRAGEYKEAYSLLSESARKGLKRSQHTLALMHIAGQAVAKNILVGVALLGLAAESGDRQLKKEYAKAIKAIPNKYQKLVREQTQYYIARYGMDAQGIVCTRVKRTDSNFKILKCYKQLGDFKDLAWQPE
jgi:hypothetical protein